MVWLGVGGLGWYCGWFVRWFDVGVSIVIDFDFAVVLIVLCGWR